MRVATVLPEMAEDTVEILQRVMREYSLNQSELASEIRMSNVTVNRWLQRRATLSERRLRDVLERMGVDPSAYGLTGSKLPRLTADEKLDKLLGEVASLHEKLDTIMRRQERAR